jgi:hypothetical protein
LEEFDEHEFLFRIQAVAHVSNLGSLLVDKGIILLSVSSGWMYVLEVLALDMTRSEGDMAKAFFSS